ncbi:MAG: hypothetical protein ISR64_08430 [Deltaproteobacteria bacterium]|nr:hypothetical protein [Deltaproteobacteria bacterium]
MNDASESQPIREKVVNIEAIKADPTPADYRRSGWVIIAAGIVTSLVGLDFFLGKTDTPDVVAACFFWAIAGLLVVIGSCEALYANRGGRPGGPKSDPR